ncbi:hypothetical protein ACIA49_21380 [Kribbella sp. NPDC051587]|uniref:hypothetical protein n=1 Tax=Kribbella sp. NPDC051587 TaxID=3364119 RepID=UPI0037A39219
MSQPTSRKVAVIAFAANLVVCGLIGTGLLLVRTPGDPADAVPKPTTSSTPTTSTSPTPTASESETPPSEPTAPASTPTPAGDYKDVFGPGGVVTKIPSGWTGKPRAGKADTQATDPARPTSFLRYGGSQSPAQPLIDVMRNAERNFSKQYPGYKLIALRPETWREHEAVTWTFEFNTADGRKHVDSTYWRAGQNDYVIYASALASNWPAMQEIYKTARDAAQP